MPKYMACGSCAFWGYVRLYALGLGVDEGVCLALEQRDGLARVCAVERGGRARLVTHRLFACVQWRAIAEPTFSVAVPYKRSELVSDDQGPEGAD